MACDKCMKVVGTSPPDQHGKFSTYKSCGWACFENAARYQVSHGMTVSQWGSAYTFSGMVLSPESSYIALKAQAESFVIAERPEDAARTYEKIGMWKEAGDLRRRARRPEVVTQVHVNMNDLIEQLRRMGLSANYTCPACHSPNSITGDMPPERLAKCQYCGAIVPSTDLVNAITKVVGYH